MAGTPGTTTYDFKQVTATLGGIIVDGWGEGDDCIVIEQETESFGHYVGADGKVCRFNNNSKVTKVTFKLGRYSATNDAFSALHNLDRGNLNGAGVVPFGVRDKNGRAVYFGPEAWIQTPPSVSLGKGVGTNDWVVIVPHCDRFDGGL